MVPSSPDLGAWTAIPCQEPLERAAEVLNSGDRRPSWAARARLLGQDALSDELPYVTGRRVCSARLLRTS